MVAKITYEHLLREGRYLWERSPTARAKDPHAKLPGSGRHTTGFFLHPGTDDPVVVETFSYELRDKILSDGVGVGITDKIDLIVGPGHETALLIEQLAQRFREHYKRYSGIDREVLTGSTRRINADTPDEDQEWVKKRGIFHRKNPCRILVVENAVATGDTAIGTIRAIRRYAKRIGAGTMTEIMPFIGCIINRSQTTELRCPEGTFRVVSCFRKQFTEWPADRCPLCEAGSPALDPRKEWAELTRA
ncbi:MAG: hypothetical protein WC400_03790 [Patescibacteria group bacterium]|jgi:hypothetical protein